jgi:hypothetical protein
MRRKNNLIIVGIVCGIIGIGLVYFFMNEQAEDEELERMVEWPEYPSIFKIMITEESYKKYIEGEQPDSARILPKEENYNIYNQVRDSVIIQNTVVVYPMFTAAAYAESGFYEYYREECDESCLTVELKDRNEYRFLYNTSGVGIQVLNILGYKFITDLEITKNPEILKDFDKVIMLHNEYVTRAEFDAITQHPNVIYLYPNALYAEVEYNESDNTIKLIRGHGYPEPEITNGFDWEFDNTHPYEYDMECNDWEFYKIDNGYMLNCYPEIKILSDVKMLKMLKTIDFRDEN